MRIEFKIEDQPPKKSGANSMWNNSRELPKILSLRKAVKNKMNELEIKRIGPYINFEFTLYIPTHFDISTIGGLR